MTVSKFSPENRLFNAPKGNSFEPTFDFFWGVKWLLVSGRVFGTMTLRRRYVKGFIGFREGLYSSHTTHPSPYPNLAPQIASVQSEPIATPRFKVEFVNRSNRLGYTP